jgi:hypothetical protein
VEIFDQEIATERFFTQQLEQAPLGLRRHLTALTLPDRSSKIDCFHWTQRYLKHLPYAMGVSIVAYSVSSRKTPPSIPSQHRQVLDCPEIAIVGDQCVGARLERTGKLHCIGAAEPVAHSQQGCQGCDRCRNRDYFILGERFFVALAERSQTGASGLEEILDPVHP